MWDTIMKCFKRFELFVFLILSSFLFASEDENENTRSNYYLDDISLNAYKFRTIGPALTSGRISDFAVNPDNYHEYYVATSSGGVWKTVNSGVTYKPIFDGQGSYSIGCVTLDPNNPHAVWVGTGENNNQRSVAYGDGVYLSRDGGESWENKGLKESEHIGKIIIDPRDSDLIYVAAIGPLWSEGGDRGVFKSTDGGNKWEAVLVLDKHTGVTDLIMDPRDPDVLYAAAHQRRRHVFTLVGGGPGSALYKTTDGGVNWEKLKRGLPSTVMGRIGLAISPANSDVIYAIVEAMNGQQGTYRSSNRGASWKKMSDYVTSGNYYQEIVAHPTDVNTLYSMSTYNMVSYDGGKAFQRLGEKDKHVDNHALWINPENPGHMLNGNDGGIYETFDNALNWHFKANLPVTQFYKVAVDNDLPFYNVYGGTQDNWSLGGPSRTTNQNGITNDDWFVTLGGDGFESQIDPDDANIVYSQYQYGNLFRFDKQSGERVDIKPRARRGEDAYRWNWDAPLHVSAHVSERIYFAANKIFRSDDRGQSWEVISEDLTRQIDRNQLKVMGRVWSFEAIEKNRSTSKYGTLVAFHESLLNGDLLFVGSDDGLIHVTEDGGKSWKKISRFPGVPDITYVNMIIASQHDENVVYAAFNNHKRGDFTPYLLKSTNKGKTWKSISSNLPKRGSIYSIAEDYKNPDLLFTGTEFGVFFSIDGGKHWKQLKSGLPTIAVRDLAIHRGEDDLVLGTFGRGFYILDDYSTFRSFSEEKMKQEAILFPVKDALLFMESTRIGGSGKSFQGASFFTTDNPNIAATFKYYLKDDIETLESIRRKKEDEIRKEGGDIKYPSLDELRAQNMELKPKLQFTLKDNAGRVVRRLQKSPSSGVHEVEWDFRYASSRPITESDVNKGEPATGTYVAPGSYTVDMSQIVDGIETKLTESVSFNVVTLANVTLGTQNRRDLADFQQKVSDLQSTLRAVGNLIDDIENRLNRMRVAAKSVKGDNANILSDIQEVQSRLNDINNFLYGDRLSSRLDIDRSPSISDRINSAVYGTISATSAPTQTHRDGYQIAREEIEPILREIQQIVKREIVSIENALDRVGAPYTPGRIPQLNRDSRR